MFQEEELAVVRTRAGRSSDQDSQMRANQERATLISRHHRGRNEPMVTVIGSFGGKRHGRLGPNRSHQTASRVTGAGSKIRHAPNFEVNESVTCCCKNAIEIENAIEIVTVHHATHGHTCKVEVNEIVTCCKNAIVTLHVVNSRV